MSCRRDKFDSQKLIQLRTFNWCATKSRRVLFKDGMIRRTNTSRYALLCAIPGTGWPNVALEEATWNDTNSSTRGQEYPRPSETGGKVWGLKRPRTSRQQNILWFPPRNRR